MDALLNHKRGPIKWGLVAHTIAMFSFFTIEVSTNLNLQSISYIDNREFHDGSMTLPGPPGYQMGPLAKKPATNITNIVFFSNVWLADGLLVGSVPTTSRLGVSREVVLLALSLLHHLCHERLGRVPMLHVCCLHRCALGSFAGRLWHFWLN